MIPAIAPLCSGSTCKTLIHWPQWPEKAVAGDRSGL